MDLLIKNGTIVDGSGGARYQADVGVKGGRIVEIGRIRTPADKVIDADGLIVSPGFIDGHTHMDAQVTWDPLGSCSCWHGVTSVMMGNCGFALAPCKPEEREWFAQCLEAVEDIPTDHVRCRLELGILSGISRRSRPRDERHKLRRLYRPLRTAHVCNGGTRPER